MADLIQLRRDTAANWTLANTVLSQGEQGYETDTGKMKIGDGSTAWTSLAYFVDSSAYATSSDITSAVATKANTADLATVATSGSYDDLSDTPTIPSIDGLATETYVDTAVSNLVDTAPAALDTLNELAAALGDDADFAGTVTTSLAAKANTADLATVATTGAYSDLTGTPTVPTALTDLSITDGTAGQVLSADGDGTYTFIDAASGGGGGGGSFEAVASGALSDGSTVVLNSDGTVSVVAEGAVPSSTSSLGTLPTAVHPNGEGWEKKIHSVGYDSINNLILFATFDNNNVKCTAGSISNGVITFGPTNTIAGWSSWDKGGIFVFFDSASEKFVVVSSRINSPSYGQHAVHGFTVAVDTETKVLTIGSPVQLMSGSSSQQISIGHNPTTGDMVGFTTDGYNGGYGVLFLFSVVSGNLVKHQELVPLSRNPGTDYWISYDPVLDKFVLCTLVASNNYSLFVDLNVFVSVSSNSMTTSAYTSSNAPRDVLPEHNMRYGSSQYNPNINKHVWVYINDKEDALSVKGLYAVCSTTAESSHTFGDAFLIDAEYFAPVAATTNAHVIYDPISQKMVVFAADLTNTKAYRLDINAAGTILSATEFTFPGSDPIFYTRPAYDSTTQKIIVATNTGFTTTLNSFTAGGNVSTNLTAENYAGIADAVYADAANATIQTAGSVDDAQSGLTPGQAYYVQADGTLSVAPGTPIVFAGTAVSATSLLIGKEAPASTVAYADVTGTPTLATVATSGAYADITGTPTVPADVSDLTDTTSLLGGGGGSFEAVASGSLSDGSTVVLNSNGTVSAVGEVESPGSLGTDYESGPAGNGNDQQISMYDSTSGKTVIVADDPTISLTTFNANGSSSYTPISVPDGFDEARYFRTAMVSIGNGKFVLSYSSSANNDTRAVVGTISGDTITWGTPYVIVSGNTAWLGLTYYAAEDKVILLAAGNFRVGTVSGTDITFGSPTATPSSSQGTLAYFPNRSKAVYIWGGSSNIALKTFTVDSSGNITLGSTVSSDSIAQSINAAQANQCSFYHTGLDKFVFTGFSDSNRFIVSVVVDIDEYGQVVVYTPKTIHTGNPRPSFVGAAYDPNINTYVVYWMSNNSSNGPSEVLHIKEATIDSNTYAITTGSLIVSLSDTLQGISSGLYIPEIQKSLMLFGTRTGRRAAVWTFTQQLTNLTAENYAGIADAVYADAATATIQTAGSVDDAQSGLTPGQAYYVQGDGTLGLNPATPRVFAGVAASATKLLIGKEGPAADLSSYATETYVTTAVSNLVDTAPAALDTLNELAAALGDDADFAGTVTTSLAAKANSADLATVATSGSYNDLSDQPVIAAGGGSFEAVASGSLSDGSTVIVNSDGTVSVVAEEGITAGFGTATTYVSGTPTRFHSSTFDSNSNKVVIAYSDNANSEYGNAVVGTVSGKSISFGTPVIFNSAQTWFNGITFDSNSNKVVISYRNQGTTTYGTAIVGTVSGTSISFGSPTVFETKSSFSHGITFDSNSNKVVIAYLAYEADGNTGRGRAIVGTVSGTGISFGTSSIFHNGTVDNIVLIFDSNSNKVVIAYEEGDTNGRAIVGTVSGTSISFGTSSVFSATNIYWYLSLSATFDSNSNKVVLAYIDQGNSYYGTAVVGTVSGTSISFGSPVVFSSVMSFYVKAIFDPSTSKVVMIYRDNVARVSTSVLGTVSGTSISFTSPIDFFNERMGQFNSLVFDSNLNKVIVFYDVSVIVYQQVDVSIPNLTAENYIGISDAAYSDGANATVQIVGSVDDAQSGLTPGQAYYVQTDGTLSTTADDPSVFAGTAVSTTKLIVKG